ncbi:tRNA pseudouridine(55) synthase [Alteripontixanthobacter maritimus]|uniref:tRNA pseudouridine synthase B n=1 Tax=Alteripontixanthobacter maritimus TaxID=2161824 RepID=A0A369Q7D3_9SPHN|nr:tRNA pseudouridine(55) synthase TruB [Alteripontixanthobacter maritimus]RDC59445.1 tRNA pseudouridine(55) synthase [Alteripontixanthobacter maritimus]
MSGTESKTAPDDASTRLSGWLVIDKPRGMGSTPVVSAVKRALREGGYVKTKVGHGGTLDPLAQGVLPIALGEATKLAGRMLDASKTYEFTIQFGEETDTLDAEGAVISTSRRRPPMEAVAAVLELFTGAIEQMPPAYSALKVDGKRAYERARAGEDVVLKPRAVTIHSLELASDYTGSGDPSELETSFAQPDPYNPPPPLVSADSVTLIASVSKGTYIRSLARDIARALGTVGHVTYLRRTKAGPFAENQAISLDKLRETASGARLSDIILPLEAGLDDIPALNLAPEEAAAVRQGRVVTGMPQTDGLYFARLGTVPVALIEIVGGTVSIVRGFNFPDVAE